jgi:hypothetical protein
MREKQREERDDESGGGGVWGRKNRMILSVCEVHILLFHYNSEVEINFTLF